MSNHYQRLLSSYIEEIEYSDNHLSNSRVAVHSLSSPEHTQAIRFTVLNETIPNTYGTHINSIATFGEKPIQCTCTKCHTSILTCVYQTPGVLSWIFCIILILCGCWLGCCLIPCCINDIQNTQHYCPNCKTSLGEYRPI